MTSVKVLPLAFTGAGASNPKLTKVDKIESSGSLLLIDTSKISSLPVNGGAITNLFESNQKTITGGNSVLTYTQNIADATASKIERTALGGFHFIAKKQPYAPFPNNYMNIKGSGSVHDWLVNKWQQVPATDHQFFISLWMRLTADPNTGMYPSNFSNNGNHNQERVYFLQGNATDTLGAVRKSTPQMLGQITPISPSLSTNFNIFNGGNTGLNSVGYTNRQYESNIFYRFYVEDLTVSGRSYATVDALDASLFATAFGSGGKFYGDVYTDPATF